MARFHKQKQLYEATKRIKLPNGAQKRLSGWGKTEAEAEEQLEQKINGLFSAPAELDDNLLTGYVARHYTPYLRTTGKRNQGQAAWALDGHILPKFGRWRLEDLTRTEIQRWVNDDLAYLSWNSRKNILKFLRQILSFVADDPKKEQVMTNAAAKVRNPKPRRRVEKRVCGLAELAEISKAAEGKVAAPAIFLGALCGLRIGEFAGQRLKHLTDEGLLVEEQIVPGGDLPESLKTSSSYRFVPMHADAVAELRGLARSGDYICARRKNKKKPGSEEKSSYYGIQGSWYKVLKSLGKESFGTHALRRSFATNLAALGCPKFIIKHLLGHTTSDVTDEYLEAVIPVCREWMERLYSEYSSIRAGGTVPPALLNPEPYEGEI